MASDYFETVVSARVFYLNQRTRSKLGRDLLCAGAFAVMFSTPAVAQDADVDLGAVQLPEIEITTARRTPEPEPVQETPVSVTIVDGNDIEPGGRFTLGDAIEASPNVVVSPQAGPIVIRGISSLGPDGGLDRPQSVGVFIDGIYIARPGGIPTFPDDLERLEIVRGPQTLRYGRNTLGGAVNLVSRDPADAVGGELETGLGQDGFRLVRGAIDAPIVPGKFLTRSFIQFNDQDGFVTNSFDGRDVGEIDNYSGLWRGLLRLGPATTLRLSVDGTRESGDGELVYAPVPLALDRRAAFDFEQSDKREIAGASAKLEHRLDRLTFTSLTGYRGFERKLFLDGDFGIGPAFGGLFPPAAQGETTSQRQFSQEFRLQSPTMDRFTWQLGAYYLHEEFSGAQLLDLAAVPLSLASRNTFAQTAQTSSVFGEVGYQLTTQLSVSSGIRYTHDKRDTESEISSPSGTFFFGLPAAAGGETSFDDVSPEFLLTYQPNQNVLTFAKVTRGFNAGGISQFIDDQGQANFYDPETAWSYEVGAKTTWFDNRFAFNVAAFLTDIQDQQVRIFTSPTTRLITNAASASTSGVEIEARAQLTEAMLVRAAYGFLKAEYDQFIDPISGSDFSGNRLPFAPENSVSAGANYRSPIGSYGVDLVGSVDYTYRSSYAFTPDNLFIQGPTHLLGARLGVAAEDNNWAIFAFGQNLLDEDYLRGYFNFSGTDFGAPARGRTLGITIKAKL